MLQNNKSEGRRGKGTEQGPKGKNNEAKHHDGGWNELKLYLFCWGSVRYIYSWVVVWSHNQDRCQNNKNVNDRHRS